MSSAAAKAEARRKAILARGTDRLAKLTTSARGDDAVVYDERPLPGSRANAVDSFVGDSGDAPHPISRKPSGTRPTVRQFSSTPTRDGPNPTVDPTAWTQEQQQQFMLALMGAPTGAPMLSNSSTLVGDGMAPNSTTSTVPQDPIATLMASMMSPAMDTLSPSLGGISPFNTTTMGDETSTIPGVRGPPPVQPRSFVQRILPFIHLFSAFSLLFFFILRSVSESSNSLTTDDNPATLSHWSDWADLRRRKQDILLNQKLPFFATFIALELALQSARILSGLDDVRPPLVVQMALPSLPPPLPSIILNGYKYSQILGVLLDDIAGIIVGIGFAVWIASIISA